MTAPKPAWMDKPQNTQNSSVPKWLADFRANGTKPASVVQPSQNPTDVVKNMPNSDKLTPFERGVYGVLPGFSQSTVGQALSKFGESWAGKALSWLDIGAEGVERTVGLASQLANQKPGEEINLKDAWYAGSLTGDMINLPQFKRDENGKITGVQIPDDLPGFAGLGKARQEIAQYVSEGMNEKDALTKVRDNYYNGLGALALRAQLYDTYFHVVADPLNYIMPTLKPVEALQARRITALTEKVAYSADELGKLAEKASQAAKVAKTAEDAAQYLDEAQRLTELATKVTSGEVKGLDRIDKFAILMTGGDSLSTPQNKLVNFVTKPFQLTPQAKANELLNMVNNNISTKIIARLWDDPDAVNQIGKAITRASKGSSGVEFGHAFLTTEGRTVQGFLGGADALVGKIVEDYNALEPQRGLLDLLKQTIGDTPENILKMADENPEVLLKTLQQKAVNNPLLTQMLQTGELDADKLNQLSKIMKDMPYDKETAIVHMLGALEEQSARQAIIQFGVEKNSLLTRWSSAIKSAESLAFMRINPSYAVRNAVNNEITMVSRGVFGIMGEAEIKSFWTDQGFIPKRLAQAFTSTGEEAVLGKGERVISEATRVNGKLEGFQDAVKNISLGKGNSLDVTKYSQAMEQSASRRSMTNGYMQFFQKFWKPPQMENALDSVTMDAINAVDDTIAGTLNDAIKSSYGSKKKFYETVGRNLNLNTESVLKAASDKLGMDVSEVLGEEVITHISDKLPGAIENNQVDKFIFETRKAIDDHIDEIFNRSVQDIVDNTAAQVQAGGPQMFYRKIADAQDAFWGAHIEHSIKSPQQWDAFREAKSAKEWSRASSIAERNLADDEKFFGRAFKRVDAYLQGLEDGATKAGIPFPSDVRRGFKDFQNNWKDFFDFRNGEYKRINGLNWQERGAEYEKLQGVLNQKYNDAVAFEDRVMQQADDAVGSLIQDPQQKAIFTKYRDQMALLNTEDKKAVIKMWEQVRNSPVEQRADIINQFFTDRKTRLDQLRQTDRAGLAAMQGDPNAAQMFEQATQQTTQGDTFNIYKFASENGVPSATDTGARNDRRILATVNKYLPEGQDKFKNVADIPEEVARQAFDARNAEKGLKPPVQQKPYVMDVKSVVPDLQPVDIGLSELSQRQFSALDAIVDGAKSQAEKTPIVLNNLPPELKDKVMGFVNRLDDEFSSAKLAATKYGEFRRDSALLNYSRRTNFDAAVANVFPFAFWTTNSMMKWAVESIDRPAMFTTYLRMKKLLETAGAPQQGFPSRFKDNIRVKIPFAPDWMGQQFWDPLRLALPFDAFAQPIEQYQKNQLTVEGRSERTLDTLLQDGKINQQEYQDALNNHSGSAWDLAKSQTIQNDDTLKFDPWDFANLMSSPHAPIQWAYNLARGTPDEIGPFTPMARTSRQIAEVLGVKDYVNSGWNIEGKVRAHLGLPAFDKWEDYRIDREISNFAGTGDFTVKQVKEAMTISALVQQGKITHEEAMQNEVYSKAVDHKDATYSGGKVGAALAILGINIKSYPEGEMNLRALGDDFGNAYDKYHKADQSLDKFLASHQNMTQEDASNLWEKQNPQLASDAKSLKDFFDKHPEYEVRLGLWDKPEERLKKFMVDSLWAQWNSLPKITKDELKDQLGDTFAQSFLDKNTRSYDSMSPEQMQMYLKLMGGKGLPGMLTADQKMITDLFSGQLELTDSETAWRANTFYSTRQQNFPNYYDLQNAYYKLASSQRKAFVAKNPELKKYWDWRRDYLTKNPDLVSYITDDPKQIAKAQKAKRNPAVAVPNANEIKANLPPAAKNILSNYAQSGDMPPVMEQYLSSLADMYGMDKKDLMGILGLPTQ